MLWPNSQHFLQLKKDKTEIILFGENEESLRIAVHLDTKAIKVEEFVKNLGVLIYYFNVLLSGCVKGRTDQEGFLEQQKHSCPNYSLQKKKNTDFKSQGILSRTRAEKVNDFLPQSRKLWSQRHSPRGQEVGDLNKTQCSIYLCIYLFMCNLMGIVNMVSLLKLLFYLSGASCFSGFKYSVSSSCGFMVLRKTEVWGIFSLGYFSSALL